MKNQKGITLIEMLISLVIASFIIGGTYQVVINQAKNYEVQDRVAEAQDSVRAGMEIMVADLRMAGYDKEGGGSNVTVTRPVSGSSKSIRVEWESDNNTIKSVEYLLSSGQLMRSVYLNGVPPKEDPPEDKVVLDNVSKLNFAYTMSGTKFKKVDITLGVKNRELSSSVIFRNVK
jgi:prepilin-type N-terminal cleavage/methylation domain-containing protein